MSQPLKALCFTVVRLAVCCLSVL